MFEIVLLFNEALNFRCEDGIVGFFCCFSAYVILYTVEYRISPLIETKISWRESKGLDLNTTSCREKIQSRPRLANYVLSNFSLTVLHIIFSINNKENGRNNVNVLIYTSFYYKFLHL